MSKHILPTESEPVGNWQMAGGKMCRDEVGERIERAIREDFDLVRRLNWRSVYRDRTTVYYWLQEYPHGEMHGGGPSSLRRILADEAERLVNEQVL